MTDLAKMLAGATVRKGAMWHQLKPILVDTRTRQGEAAELVAELNEKLADLKPRLDFLGVPSDWMAFTETGHSWDFGRHSVIYHVKIKQLHRAPDDADAPIAENVA